MVYDLEKKDIYVIIMSKLTKIWIRKITQVI
jgi:hypothetical protein